MGAYTIVRRLGAGGAGEVWLARDERLGRDVAIKVLLPHFSQDTERVHRFAEEARTAGSLNHSNILAVYDVGEHRGAPFLVSEFLQGESLRKRLESGPLPVNKAIAIALDVARGLAAVHARGIIHRDLKPDNVFLRSDGGVKILDFGLAKLHLPSIDGLHTTTPHTITGVVLGTAGYMAPEQIRGGDVDARSDLFALGATMYEMLSGQRPFAGGSTFETLHAILSRDPVGLIDVNAQVPPALADIVKRLLEKSPDARFQSAAGLAAALEQIAERPAHPNASRAPRKTSMLWRSQWFSWATAAALTATLLAGGWWLASVNRRAPAATQLMQFTWTLPAGTALDSAPVVSPDSQHVAFVGRNATGTRMFVRDLASLEAVVLSGTGGAKQPFWSPDSRSIGFFARGKLMKVALAAGAPVVIADAIDGRGGAWSPSGTIVFTPDLLNASLFKVSANGGRVEPATLLDRAQGENSHRWPVFLPDGIHLYFVKGTTDERRGVYIGRVDGAAVTPGAPLFRSESEALYVPRPSENVGDLLYVSNGKIEARSFDAQRRTLIGDGRTLDLRASQQSPYHSMTFSASSTVITFTPSRVPFGLRLTSVDRNGENLHAGNSEPQGWVRLSPDGQRLAGSRIDAMRGNPDLWVEDLARGTRVRVTTAAGADMLPVWSPDGKRLAYVTGSLPGRQGQRTLTISAADGTGILQTFACPGEPGTYCEPTDWSHDGRHLIVNVFGVRGRDVWTVAVQHGGSTRPLLAEPYSERDARISPPDGRWISYVSDESGRPDVSVRNMSGPPARIVLSGDGGEQPVWRRDGAEIFFVDLQGRFRSVAVRGTPDGLLAFGLPVELTVPPLGVGHWGHQYDVSPDGRRIYFMRATEEQASREITVVVAWRSLLK